LFEDADGYQTFIDYFSTRRRGDEGVKREETKRREREEVK